MAESSDGGLQVVSYIVSALDGMKNLQWTLYERALNLASVADLVIFDSLRALGGVYGERDEDDDNDARLSGSPGMMYPGSLFYIRESGRVSAAIAIIIITFCAVILLALVYVRRRRRKHLMKKMYSSLENARRKRILGPSLHASEVCCRRVTGDFIVQSSECRISQKPCGTNPLEGSHAVDKVSEASEDVSRDLLQRNVCFDRNVSKKPPVCFSQHCYTNASPKREGKDESRCNIQHYKQSTRNQVFFNNSQQRRYHENMARRHCSFHNVRRRLPQGRSAHTLHTAVKSKPKGLPSETSQKARWSGGISRRDRKTIQTRWKGLPSTSSATENQYRRLEGYSKLSSYSLQEPKLHRSQGPASSYSALKNTRIHQACLPPPIRETQASLARKERARQNSLQEKQLINHWEMKDRPMKDREKGKGSKMRAHRRSLSRTADGKRVVKKRRGAKSSKSKTSSKGYASGAMKTKSVGIIKRQKSNIDNTRNKTDSKSHKGKHWHTSKPYHYILHTVDPIKPTPSAISTKDFNSESFKLRVIEPPVLNSLRGEGAFQTYFKSQSDVRSSVYGQTSESADKRSSCLQQHGCSSKDTITSQDPFLDTEGFGTSTVSHTENAAFNVGRHNTKFLGLHSSNDDSLTHNSSKQNRDSCWNESLNGKLFLTTKSKHLSNNKDPCKCCWFSLADVKPNTGTNSRIMLDRLPTQGTTITASCNENIASKNAEGHSGLKDSGDSKNINFIPSCRYMIDNNSDHANQDSGAGVLQFISSSRKYPTVQPANQKADIKACQFIASSKTLEGKERHHTVPVACQKIKVQFPENTSKLTQRNNFDLSKTTSKPRTARTDDSIDWSQLPHTHCKCVSPGQIFKAPNPFHPWHNDRHPPNLQDHEKADTATTDNHNFNKLKERFSRQMGNNKDDKINAHQEPQCQRVNSTNLKNHATGNTKENKTSKALNHKVQEFSNDDKVFKIKDNKITTLRYGDKSGHVSVPSKTLHTRRELLHLASDHQSNARHQMGNVLLSRNFRPQNGQVWPKANEIVCYPKQFNNQSKEQKRTSEEEKTFHAEHSRVQTKQHRGYGAKDYKGCVTLGLQSAQTDFEGSSPMDTRTHTIARTATSSLANKNPNPEPIACGDFDFRKCGHDKANQPKVDGSSVTRTCHGLGHMFVTHKQSQEGHHVAVHKCQHCYEAQKQSEMIADRRHRGDNSGENVVHRKEHQQIKKNCLSKEETPMIKMHPHYSHIVRKSKSLISVGQMLSELTASSRSKYKVNGSPRHIASKIPRGKVCKIIYFKPVHRYCRNVYPFPKYVAKPQLETISSQPSEDNDPSQPIIPSENLEKKPDYIKYYKLKKIKSYRHQPYKKISSTSSEYMLTPPNGLYLSGIRNKNNCSPNRRGRYMLGSLTNKIGCTDSSQNLPQVDMFENPVLDFRFTRNLQRQCPVVSFDEICTPREVDRETSRHDSCLKKGQNCVGGTFKISSNPDGRANAEKDPKHIAKNTKEGTFILPKKTEDTITTAKKEVITNYTSRQLTEDNLPRYSKHAVSTTGPKDQKFFFTKQEKDANQMHTEDSEANFSNDCTTNCHFVNGGKDRDPKLTVDSIKHETSLPTETKNNSDLTCTEDVSMAVKSELESENQLSMTSKTHTPGHSMYTTEENTSGAMKQKYNSEDTSITESYTFPSERKQWRRPQVSTLNQHWLSLFKKHIYLAQTKGHSKSHSLKYFTQFQTEPFLPLEKGRRRGKRQHIERIIPMARCLEKQQPSTENHMTQTESMISSVHVEVQTTPSLIRIAKGSRKESSFKSISAASKLRREHSRRKGELKSSRHGYHRRPSMDNWPHKRFNVHSQSRVFSVQTKTLAQDSSSSDKRESRCRQAKGKADNKCSGNAMSEIGDPENRLEKSKEDQNIRTESQTAACRTRSSYTDVVHNIKGGKQSPLNSRSRRKLSSIKKSDGNNQAVSSKEDMLQTGGEGLLRINKIEKKLMQTSADSMLFDNKSIHQIDLSSQIFEKPQTLDVSTNEDTSMEISAADFISNSHDIKLQLEDTLDNPQSSSTSTFSHSVNTKDTKDTSQASASSSRLSELRKLCVMRPMWKNANIDEIDRRVRRALRLREELQLSRYSSSRTADSASSNTVDPESRSINTAVPSGKAEVHLKDQTVKLKHLQGDNPSSSVKGNQVLDNTTRTPNEHSIRAGETQKEHSSNFTTLSPQNQFGQNIAGNSGSAVTLIKTPLQKASAFCKEAEQSNMHSISLSHATRVKSIGNDARETDASFRVERSLSFHEDSVNDIVNRPKGSSSAHDSSHQSKSNSGIASVKRSGNAQKCSPPTKISKVENTPQAHPKLVGELVQSLPQVPLSSFVEWFIETSDPKNFITSEKSSSSSEKASKCPGHGNGKPDVQSDDQEASVRWTDTTMPVTPSPGNHDMPRNCIKQSKHRSVVESPDSNANTQESSLYDHEKTEESSKSLLRPSLARENHDGKNHFHRGANDPPTPYTPGLLDSPKSINYAVGVKVTGGKSQESLFVTENATPNEARSAFSQESITCYEARKQNILFSASNSFKEKPRGTCIRSTWNLKPHQDEGKPRYDLWMEVDNTANNMSTSPTLSESHFAKSSKESDDHDCSTLRNSLIKTKSLKNFQVTPQCVSESKEQNVYRSDRCSSTDTKIENLSKSSYHFRQRDLLDTQAPNPMPRVRPRTIEDTTFSEHNTYMTDGTNITAQDSHSQSPSQDKEPDDDNDDEVETEESQILDRYQDEDNRFAPGIRHILMKLRHRDEAEERTQGDRMRIMLRKSSDVTGIIAKFQKERE